MCIRRETQEKARRSLAFSRVSKPHIHITHMLRQCTSIVYIFPGNYKMFFKITQVASLYARVGILLTCGRHLHDHIIVLRPEVFWVHKTILTLLLYTEVHALSLESERSCICVSGVSISPISTILIFVLKLFRQCGILLFFIL